MAPGGRGRQRQLPLAQLPPARRAGGAGHRGSPLLLAPWRGRHPHGRRHRHQPARRQALPGGRQHAHAAAGQELVPDAGEDLHAQGARAGDVDRPRAAAHEGPDPGAVPQRRVPGAAGIVLRARRGRGRAPVLRQGREQRLAGRSGDAGRHHPVACRVLAHPSSGAGPRTARRRAARDARGRLRHARGRRDRDARAAADRPGQRRRRGARTSSTTSRSWSASRWRCARRRRASPSTPRWTCTCSAWRRTSSRRAWPTSRRGSPSAVRSAGRCRRRWWPSIRGRARSSRWSAAGRTSGRSTTGPTSAKRQPGSTFKPFVFLSAFDLAQREGRTDLTPATVLSDEPTTFMVNGEEWSPRNYDGEHDGAITAAPRPGAIAQPGHHPDGGARPATRHIASPLAQREAGVHGPRLPVDRAWRLRGHAARDGRGLHPVPQPRRGAAAARGLAHRDRRRHRAPARLGARAPGGAARPRRSW